MNIGDVYKNLEFDEALPADDDRYVDTINGRGETFFDDLYGFLNINKQTMTFRSDLPKNVKTIFCGHRGCGKSTELNRLATKLQKEELFYVIQIDTSEKLNINDIQFVDVFMALAEELFKKLHLEKIKIPIIYLENLQKWFSDKLITEDIKKELALGVESGVEVKAEIPIFFKLFSNLTSSFKNTSTFTETLRRNIQNSFSEFSQAFNQLIAEAQNQIEKKRKGKCILFIVDGLDKLDNTASDEIFIKKSPQINQIKTNMIFTAQIDLLYSGNQIQQYYKTVILPMIKLYDKDGVTKFEAGWQSLRKLLFKRADSSLFEAGVADKIIDYSGGNPRHILQILEYCYINDIENDKFTIEGFRNGLKRFQKTYERFLTEEDYSTLYEQDCNIEDTTPSDAKRKLLHNLALLQYNSFWWKSHPVIREIKAYQKLKDGHKS
jgi:energy-coupling factor transporter ATP-binding protein EcfA2